jgi:hypothetical protein
MEAMLETEAGTETTGALTLGTMLLTIDEALARFVVENVSVADPVGPGTEPVGKRLLHFDLVLVASVAIEVLLR